MEELLAKDEKELPIPSARLEEARLDAREDAKWQRRRELMAKVTEGLYQFRDDQMAGNFPCFDETTATRLRRLQAKDVQQLLRGFEAPNSSRGAWSALWRPSTSPRWSTSMRPGSAPRDSRLASALAWPGEPPPGQGAHILDLPLLHHALGEEGRHEVHGG